MPGSSTAYLVVRRDDGFGDVYPLSPGTRYTLGRSPANRIVLKDDMCSREHAEIYSDDSYWYLRDLGSLNGSKINMQPVSGERRLVPQDEVLLGRSRFLFLLDLGELPDLPVRSTPASNEQIAIKKRLGLTRYLPALPPIESAKVSAPIETPPQGVSAEEGPRPSTLQALSILYRLGLEMGNAGTPVELVQVVLNGLLEAIPAEVGAVLELKDTRTLDLIAYHQRDAKAQTYHKVSQFVSSEVLSTHEAILAENVSADKQLSNRESLAELRVAGLICAPVMFGKTILGLIHLYSTDGRHVLTTEDLEFAIAVAKQLGNSWHNLVTRSSLSVENRSLRDQLRLESELVGASDGLRLIETQISRVAETSATVLIRGESGVGKELVARAIHMSSPRKAHTLVCLNCAAVTESLLESELFGHEKGSFTGATERMMGKFEAADKGTLFLDEIGEMNPSAQAKLLRVLEGHPFERVGGNVPIKVDVRVVAATNRPLEEAVRAGTFRKDLFYRLQVVELRVPPLRERMADVPILADHFLKRFVRETGRKIRAFTPAAIEKLKHHSWPGNVRELRNVIERAVALNTGPMLDADDIWLSAFDLGGSDAPSGVTGEYEAISLEEMEKRHILHTLNHTDWNKSQAATILEIERSTLDRKIKAYNIQR